jgi:hypothetical protein
MPDLPLHSDEADARPAAPARRGRIYLLIGAVVLAVAVFVGLHLAGVVGPGAH